MTWQLGLTFGVIALAVGYIVRTTVRGWRRHAGGGCHGCGMQKLRA